MAEGSAASTGGSRRAQPRPRPQRLAALSRRSPQPVWLPSHRRSAVGRCPGFAVAQYGVEDGQQLAHGSDEGETGRFAGLAPTTGETLECRVVLDCDQTGHVKWRPDLDAPWILRLPRYRPLSRFIRATPARAAIWWRPTWPSSGSSAIRVRATTLPMPGTLLSRSCLAHQTGLASISLSIAPSMRAPLGIEPLEHRLERALRHSVLGVGKALLLAIDHDHQLAAAGHQLLQTVDDRYRQPRLGQSGGGNHTLVAAAGFQDDKPRPQWPQPPDQGSQTLAVGRAMERGAVGPDMCVDPRFGTSMPIKRSACDLASIAQPPRCGLVPRGLFGFIGCRPALPRGLTDLEPFGLPAGLG